MGSGIKVYSHDLLDDLQVQYLRGDSLRAGLPLPLPINKTCFLLLRSGSVKIQEMDRAVSLLADQVLLCHMWLHYGIVEVKGEAIIRVLSFEREFALRHTKEEFQPQFFALLTTDSLPSVSLSYVRLYGLLVLLSRFDALGDMGNVSPRYTELLLKAFNYLAQELVDIYAKYLRKVYIGGNLHDYRLVLKFLHLVERHCTQWHGVKWYVQTLHVSSHYLYKELRAVKGKTTKDCINEALMRKSRILLQKGGFINDIGEELGFGTQQAFTRFIKKHTSLTPTQYRELLEEGWGNGYV